MRWRMCTNVHIQLGVFTVGGGRGKGGQGYHRVRVMVRTLGQTWIPRPYPRCTAFFRFFLQVNNEAGGRLVFGAVVDVVTGSQPRLAEQI